MKNFPTNQNQAKQVVKNIDKQLALLDKQIATLEEMRREIINHFDLNKVA